MGRGGDREGYDQDIMAFESGSEDGDGGVIDFGDCDGGRKGNVAFSTGEGGDGVGVLGEERGEDVVAYVSCCLSLLSVLGVKEGMFELCVRLTPTMATFLIEEGMIDIVEIELD